VVLKLVGPGVELRDRGLEPVYGPRVNGGDVARAGARTQAIAQVV